VGNTVQRQLYFRQNTRSPAEVRGTLFPEVHALHLIDRIVFAILDLYPAGLGMYIAQKLPALVFHCLLEMNRLYLRHVNLTLLPPARNLRRTALRKSGTAC